MLAGFIGFRIGDRVKARRDLHGGAFAALAGSPAVKQGRPGIVRAIRTGLLTDRLTVEFDTGWSTRTLHDLPSSAVTRALLGHGEAAWSRRRDYAVGARLGLLAAFGLPALFALVSYLASGGTIAELIPALVSETAALAMALLLGPLGPVIAIAAVVTWYLRRRRT